MNINIQGHDTHRITIFGTQRFKHILINENHVRTDSSANTGTPTDKCIPSLVLNDLILSEFEITFLHILPVQVQPVTSPINYFTYKYWV